MTWIRRLTKKLISKISVDSDFTFPSYAWSCVICCSHRLLCGIKSRIRDFLWKLFSFHTKMILNWFLWGSVLLRGEVRKYAKQSSFETFESALYSTPVSMPLNFILTKFKKCLLVLTFVLELLDSMLSHSSFCRHHMNNQTLEQD